MKKIFSICLVIMLSISLVGCGNNTDLQEKENEMQISNKKIEGIIKSYNENIDFLNKNTNSIVDALFNSDYEISESLFYNFDESLEVFILNQMIEKRCIKYELDMDIIKEESKFYSFLDDTNGSVVWYYIIPLEYETLYIEMIIQNSLIYSVDYELK